MGGCASGFSRQYTHAGGTEWSDRGNSIASPQLVARRHAALARGRLPQCTCTAELRRCKQPIDPSSTSSSPAPARRKQLSPFSHRSGPGSPDVPTILSPWRRLVLRALCRQAAILLRVASRVQNTAGRLDAIWHSAEEQWSFSFGQRSECVAIVHEMPCGPCQANKATCRRSPYRRLLTNTLVGCRQRQQRQPPIPRVSHFGIQQSQLRDVPKAGRHTRVPSIKVSCATLLFVRASATIAHRRMRQQIPVR